ncbi:MAG: hypothetical protein ACP5FQ_07440 [Thermoplasmata archaeon]
MTYRVIIRHSFDNSNGQLRGTVDSYLVQANISKTSTGTREARSQQINDILSSLRDAFEAIINGNTNDANAELDHLWIYIDKENKQQNVNDTK